MKTINEQMKLIKKGVLELHSEAELKSKLEKSNTTGRPLIIKLGLDPTAPDLHLGHTVVLRKIRQFQSLGHKAFIIIGDFTGRIGDPSGKSKGRVQLSEKEVLENAETYKKQLLKVLDPDKTVIFFNSEWLSALKIEDLMLLMSKQTVARILERESFKKRMQANQPIGLHELLYPLLQGIDSLELEADVEIGGTDQTFNILMGRDMQGTEEKEKQVAIFMPILEGLDGVQKMSKSLGNYIGVDEEPGRMYEKVMQIKDDMIIRYFELITDVEPDQIKDYSVQIESGRTNPKNIKMCLAREIVRLYHSKEMAIKAEEKFVTVHSKGEVPKDMISFDWEPTDDMMIFLVRNNIIKSKSEVRRLIEQQGISINGQVMDMTEHRELISGDVIKIGKKRFVSIK
ncbi:MAG: tyrosine--tRNA ligase [Vallitaleaceae bacterium]|jgi:tyrosyl-tRNA synthetase|nr:tyrosine--tRNA ligase [Vallitaleaceae bacterium]